MYQYKMPAIELQMFLNCVILISISFTDHKILNKKKSKQYEHLFTDKSYAHGTVRGFHLSGAV